MPPSSKRLHYYPLKGTHPPPPRFRTLLGLRKPYIVLVKSSLNLGGYLWGGTIADGGNPTPPQVPKVLEITVV